MRTPSPVVAAADPAVTRRTCVDAVRAASDGLYVFNTQMATLERAAARDDQAALIHAATVITNKFTELSATLITLSRRPVSTSVRATLVKASATVAGLGAVSYQGTPADQRAALTRVKASLVQACA
ncbi:MAG TPA: hypothetical protein VF163_00390 [Micromonosporaceae bacterium]